MQDFLDLRGASGATYRFHSVGETNQLPAIAGNFVYVQGRGEQLNVVCCGSVETLLHAKDSWTDAAQKHGALAVFVRRNVSWKTRAREHADVVEAYRPKMVVAAELEGINAPTAAPLSHVPFPDL